MSEVVRLSLVAHAMTDAVAAGRFPADEPLNDLGHRQVDAAGIGNDFDFAFCGPETRTRQTAERLGLQAQALPELADLDHGRWRGNSLGDIDPGELAVWLTDPARAPHGGESIVDLVERVRRWLQTASTRHGKVIAVTHPAVIRAVILMALDAPPRSFWRIDIAPVSRTVLHHRADAWTLRSS